MKLRCRDRHLSLDRTVVMGVLNVTPDSFSDGGLWLDPKRAVDHAMEMVAEGAGIVDVGGESTRPGAEPVTVEEELRRVLPVVEVLSGRIAEPISIDTRKPEVARRALGAGASIVNDTAGERSDRSIDAVVSESGAGVIVMHSRGTPATMPELTDYGDVVGEVSNFLSTRAKELEAAGVDREAISVDPGIGFAKSAEQSLRLLQRLDELTELGYPVAIGTSRKSFIERVLDLPLDQRVEATAATAAWAVMKGARIVRAHDVQPVVRTVRMIEAISSAGS
jgi:dihydropteroate synthase